MGVEYLPLVMFAGTCGILLLGFPVVFTLAGVALCFAYVGATFDLLNLKYFGAIPSRIVGVMTNEVLVSVPLSVFMGVMLERSRIAEQLLQTMSFFLAVCAVCSACRLSRSALCWPPPPGLLGRPW